MQLNEMETLLSDVDQRTRDIDARVTQIDARVTRMDVRVAHIDERVTNIDDRVSNIEQILPTLATKEDLKAYATKADLEESFDHARRESRVLYEDLKDDIRLLAENLVRVHERLDTRGF